MANSFIPYRIRPVFSDPVSRERFSSICPGIPDQDRRMVVSKTTLAVFMWNVPFHETIMEGLRG